VSYPTFPIKDPVGITAIAGAVRDMAELIVGMVETNNAVGVLDALSEMNGLVDPDEFGAYALMMLVGVDQMQHGSEFMQTLGARDATESPAHKITARLGVKMGELAMTYALNDAQAENVSAKVDQLRDVYGV
jgi:hypothetical protein